MPDRTPARSHGFSHPLREALVSACPAELEQRSALFGCGGARASSGGRRRSAAPRPSLRPRVRVAQRQRPAALEEQRLVQRRQRLQRRVRARRGGRRRSRRSGRRTSAARVRHRAVAERVERAPVAVRPRLLVPGHRPVAGRRQEQERRRGRIDARPADLRGSAARWPRGRCRGRLGLDPEPRPARQQAVVRIRAQQLRRDAATTAGRSPTSTISRCSAFRLQPLSMNSTASQSSSSGCDGASPGCRSPRWC